MIKTTLRLFCALGVFLMLLGVLSPAQTFGMSSEQKKLFQGGILYFDISTCATVTAANNTGSGTGKAYMIGDSIAAGAQPQLEAALKGKGFTEVIINALASRRLSTGNDPLDGISVLESDKDQWANANTIIIELGTNGGANAENIKKTMELIKTNNTTGVKVYWVNIATNGGKIDAGPINAQLQQSAAEGYAIIDWASQVAAHPDYIDTTDGYGVHPSAAGKEPFASTVADGAVAGGSVPTSSPNPNCACKAGASSNLVGSDNAEKTWNFLVGKGLTPEQAAGFMGNLQAEGHFEPKLVEYGWKNSRGETSAAGQPSSLDDAIPPNQNEKGQPGYGIVQWTSPGRKQGLADKAAAMGLPPSDLGVQLEYLWDELQGPYKASVYDPILTMTTVAEVSKLVLYKFENPGNKETQTPIREGFANDFLAQYGSNTAGPSAAGTNACGGGGNGEVVGGFSLPVDKSFYQSNPEWFSNPHHTYPASDIPVPEGTPIYSMTAGKIVKAPTGPAKPVGQDAPGGDKCGAGVTIEAAPGIQFLYCHGSDGGTIDGAKEGDTVQAGQLIMHSSHTGHTKPSGPAGTHLHLGITVDGVQRCPQTLMKSIADGAPIQDLKSLPTGGCVGG